MSTLKDYRDERIRKLEEMRKLGINPYPANAHRTNLAKEITDNFESLQGTEVSVLGRIINIRKFGKIAFIVVKDVSGNVQLFLKQEMVALTDPKENMN